VAHNRTPLGGKLIDTVYLKYDPQPVFVRLNLIPFTAAEFPGVFLHTFIFIRPLEAE
jgi:hypothetical protein